MHTSLAARNNLRSQKSHLEGQRVLPPIGGPAATHTPTHPCPSVDPITDPPVPPLPLSSHRKAVKLGET